jgi:hypothetical protein
MIEDVKTPRGAKTLHRSYHSPGENWNEAYVENWVLLVEMKKFDFSEKSNFSELL